jgi:hypothetical protein
MDQIVTVYLWASILISILFFVVSSKLVYWITNRITTSIWLPPTFIYSQGGPTLFGMVVSSLIFFGIVFGIVDFVYSTLLNGDDDSKVKVE